MKNISIIPALVIGIVFSFTFKSYTQCSFTISNPSPCPGESIILTVTNPMPDSIYTWDFTSNGSIDATGTSVTTSYPYNTSSMTYTVTLKKNGNSCSTKQVMVKPSPDPTIGLDPMLSSPGTTISGDTIKKCSGTPNSTLAIYNASSTFSSNASYEINWGDGITEFFTNVTFPTTTSLVHNYTGYGYKYITVKVIHANGCYRTKTYTYYSGSNPSVGLTNPGGTVGLCAPSSITFPISNTAGNPPGTVYTITVNGNVVQTYNQSNIPNSFTYNFTASSCNEVTTSGLFENAFDLRILASNPCGSSAATVEPIELSTQPVANFIITEPANKCPDEIWTFTDNSTNINEVISGNPSVCNDSIPPSWQITPGTNGNQWSIISGNLFASEVLKVRFLEPGVYTITMTVISSICGPSIITKTITVLEPPTADADALFSASNGCIPTTVSFDNLSTGYQVSYNWMVTPPTGWAFSNGTSATSENPAISFNAAGTYNVKLTTTNICDVDTWDTTLTFIAKPTITWSDIPDFCLNATLNFSSSNITFASPGTPITSYQWNFTGGSPANSTSQYPTNIVYNTPGTYTVSVSATNICGTTTVSQTFVVQAPTTITLPPNFQICLNASPVTLAGSPIGGTWSGLGITPQGIFNPANANIGDNVLTYSYGNGACTGTATVTATVFQLPPVNAGANQSACVDANPIPLIATPTGGTWSSSAGGVLNGNTFSPSASGPGMYTLTYSFTSAQGCANSDNLVFTVNPLPVVSANDTTYCNTPGSVQLPFASPPGGAWSGTGVTGNQFNPSTAGGVGTYTATYSFTNANNCSNSTTIDINVINPSNVTAGPDTSFCQSVTSYNLSPSASPSGGVWSTTGTGLTGAIFNPSQAGPGAHILTYSVGAGNCLITDQIVVTVYALPAVNAGADKSACVDATPVALTGTPAGGTWSSSAGGVLNGNSFNPNAAGPGIYTLTYSFTSAQGCSNSDNLAFTVYALPVMAANDTTYCNTPGSVQLPFASPPGGTWSGAGITGNQFNPVAAGGVGTYTATYGYTNANGCSNSTTIDINVINPSNVTAGPDTSFCQSVTSYNLSPSASPSGGVWSTTGTGLTGSIFNPSQAGPGTHTLTYSVGAGNCLVSDPLVITVYALPSINAGTDLSGCETDAPVTLVATPIGGTWSSSTGGVLNGNSFEPSTSNPGTYTLTYSFTDSLGCSNANEIAFTIFPLPNVVSNDTTYCNTPGTVLLPYSSPFGGTWTGPGSNGNLFDPIIAGGVGDYQLTYTVTDVHGCIDSTEISVSVIEPVTVSAGVNDTICVNEGTLQLVGFAPPGGTWSGPGIVNPLQGVFDPTVPGGGLSTLTYSVGSGNCEVRDSIEIFVIQIDINPGPSEEFCLNDNSIQLSGYSPVGGYWVGPGIIDSISGTFDPSVAGVGFHQLAYFYQDALLGCVFSVTKEMTVHPMPESYFEIPGEACINNLIQFNNLSQNTFQVNWSFGDGTFSNLANPTHSYTIAGWYTIELTTTTEFGCTDSYSVDIFITEPPVVDFETDVTEGCAVLAVNFTNSSYGYQVAYFWDFGNGQTDTVSQPGTVFFDQGTKDTTYQVTLSVSNQCATVTQTDTITVFPLPQINFGTSIDTSCSPMVVAFANLTLGNPENFYWDFGNGNTSTDSLPGPQTYYTDSVFITYPITLIATNFCGADTAVHKIVVTPANVDAFFNIPSNIGCQPLAMQFANYSTPGTSISWDFGDGNTSALPNPLHTFENTGTFVVIQYASTGCGYDSTIATITILPAPDVEFEHLPAVCRGDSIQFLNTSPSMLSGTLWHFGDGDSSLLNSPYHIYDTAGIYTVTFQGISTLNGCVAQQTGEVLVWELPTMNFEPSAPGGCMPLSISFNNLSSGASYFTWNFGDGNTGVGSEPSHTYLNDGSFSVILVGTDTNGCADTSSFNYIQVYPLPIADFSMNRDRLCGIPVTLSVVNNSQGAQGYIWAFGDGAASTLVNPSHQYDFQGYYQVVLIAENAFSCRDTIAMPFNTYPIPLAEFDVLPGLGCEPLPVGFLNYSTGSNRYYWSFGDQQSSSEFEPNHIYLNDGLYSIQLIASFDDVCFDTLELENLVTVLPSPFANFAYQEVNQGVPIGIIQFNNLSEDASTYVWDFGDGNLSNEESPLHRYYENGVWQVLLEAIGSNGCKDDTLLLVKPDFFRGLFIPNAFSPEQGLGEVRLFKPKGVGLKEYKIEVFSPYGQLIWKSESLSEGQPDESWDGSLNGHLLPQDVYVWKAYGIFEDGTVWQGMPDKNGNPKTMGSLVLLR